MELLAFLASLEANKKNRNHVDAQFDVEEVVGKRMLFDGGHSKDYFLECEET